jgi:hypothetical protein
MHRRFITIVEGHGEQKALPLLIRRIFVEIAPLTFPTVDPPIRVKSGSFLNDPDYFGKYVSYAADKAAQVGGEILILLDCEDDCPAALGPSLLAKARSIRGDVRTTVILAHHEYETRFLAAAESLRGRGLPADVAAPSQPESIRGAKEWLGKSMGQPYDPIIHQAAFTARFDLTQAKTVPSFARFISKILS